MPSVSIHTHGCKLNQADSSQLARRFLEAGYRLVDSVTEADVFVLNTCTITATADAKARQALRSAHRKNPNAIIVATGCYPQRAARELDQLDAVSLVVGNTEKAELVSRVSAIGRVLHPTNGASSSPPQQPLEKQKSASQYIGRARAMIKIQEGCNQVCAYCIVPRVRGRERSIPPDFLIEQVNHHLSGGGQEVVLTGTQLGTYGYDLPATNLSHLLQRLLKETSVPRLRVSSLQAHEITPELIDLWRDHRLCPHFHVPLQSGCDRVLKAMRRRYDTVQFDRTTEMIRHALPHAAITTDIIVGFPGETETDFTDSLQFAESIGFSDMHVFPYSTRPGTSAAYLENPVSESCKEARMGQMLNMARRNFVAFRAQQWGKVRPVLWQTSDTKRDGTWWSGLTDNYVRVSARSRLDLRNKITLARLGKLERDSVRTELI